MNEIELENRFAAQKLARTLDSAVRYRKDEEQMDACIQTNERPQFESQAFNQTEGWICLTLSFLLFVPVAHYWVSFLRSVRSASKRI